MTRGKRILRFMLAVALVGLGALASGASVRADEVDPCAVPAQVRPPDLRCQERLDGRPPPVTPVARAAGRLLLLGPQLASRVVFWPIVQTGGFIESHRLHDWMKAILTSDDGRVGVRPDFSYSTGFLATGGAHLFYRPAAFEGSQLTLRAHSGGTSAWLGEVSAVSPDAIGLRARGTFERRRDRLYAGIGSASRSELEAAGRGLSRFGSDLFQGEVAWSRALTGRLTGTVTGDLQRRDYQANQVHGGPSVSELYALPPTACAPGSASAACLDPAYLPHFDSGLRLLHAGGALALHLGSEARDGSRLQVAVDGRFGEGIAGDPSRHVRVGAQSVLSLGGIDRALFLRLRGEAVDPVGDAPVPFDELVTPAGATGLRGFPEGRLRGRSGWVGTAEYRWFIAFNLDASLFVDLGTVAGPRFRGLGEARLFPSVGMGLRLFSTNAHYWQARVVDGLQVVYARESGVRFLFSTATF